MIDFVPTFMELAGDKSSYPKYLTELDGISLVPTFSGNKLKRKNPLFFQYGSWQVIRQEWKLVQRKKEPWQLYDLSKDRTEMRDLALHFPERVKLMKRKWTEMAKEVGGDIPQ